MLEIKFPKSKLRYQMLRGMFFQRKTPSIETPLTRAIGDGLSSYNL